jgi:hypothetical protein
MPILYTVCVVTSGCEPREVKVCGISLSEFYNTGNDTGKVSGYFRFSVGGTSSDEICTTKASDLFISACYAKKPSPIWKNDLDTATFKLIFDRKIVSGIDTLFAQEDILKHPAFKKYVPVSRSATYAVMYVIGTSDSTATTQMVFEAGVYKATFTCTTTDGKALLAERYLRFEQ